MTFLFDSLVSVSCDRCTGCLLLLFEVFLQGAQLPYTLLGLWLLKWALLFAFQEFSQGLVLTRGMGLMHQVGGAAR